MFSLITLAVCVVIVVLIFKFLNRDVKVDANLQNNRNNELRDKYKSFVDNI